MKKTILKKQQPKFENKVVNDDFLKKWWAHQIAKANTERGKK